MSTKVAIAVVVAVVALFVAALALSDRRGEGDLDDLRTGDDNDEASGDEDGFPANLSRRLASSAAVDRSDLTIGCLDPDDADRLLFTGSCEIVVAGSSERMRLLRLRTSSDIEVEAPAPEGEDDEDDGANENYMIEADFDAGEEITLAIGRERTLVTLGCRNGISSECLVRLVDD